MAREPFKKAHILLEIETCQECPMCTSHRTLNAGFAIDYYCSHPSLKDYTDCNDEYRQREAVGRKVMGYVEWSSDENPVPDWCPIRHGDCKDYINTLESQILGDITCSDWAIEHLLEIDRLREEIDRRKDVMDDLRNKYGMLHTYWQILAIDSEFELNCEKREKLLQADELFVKLLKED